MATRTERCQTALSVATVHTRYNTGAGSRHTTHDLRFDVGNQLGYQPAVSTNLYHTHLPSLDLRSFSPHPLSLPDTLKPLVSLILPIPSLPTVHPSASTFSSHFPSRHGSLTAAGRVTGRLHSSSLRHHSRQSHPKLPSPPPPHPSTPPTTPRLPSTNLRRPSVLFDYLGSVALNSASMYGFGYLVWCKNSPSPPPSMSESPYLPVPVLNPFASQQGYGVVDRGSMLVDNAITTLIMTTFIILIQGAMMQFGVSRALRPPIHPHSVGRPLSYFSLWQYRSTGQRILYTLLQVAAPWILVVLVGVVCCVVWWVVGWVSVRWRLRRRYG